MDDASDLSRRIDELLSGAIDEQVREQRVLADLMLGVRDSLSQLSDRISSVHESVEAAREASERVQLAPSSAAPVDSFSDRFESIETAVGELSATVAALADRPDPATLDPEEARALFGATAEAAREAAAGESGSVRNLVESQTTALRDAMTTETSSMREQLFGELLAARESLLAETAALKESAASRHEELTRAFTESKERTDELERRLASIELSLAEFGRTPGELRDAVAELMGGARDQGEALLQQIRSAGETSAARSAEAAERLADNSSMIVSALDTIAARFETLQESLLAYLQVRDIALEEERDRVISELLEEFARGMDAKQRKLFAGGVRGAWASRRDKRDARRFRVGTGKNLPKMPEIPSQTLKAAAEQLAKPVAAPEPRPAAAGSERGPVAVVGSLPRPVAVAPSRTPKAPAKPKAPVVKKAAPAKKAAPVKKAAKPRPKASEEEVPAAPESAAPVMIDPLPAPEPEIALESRPDLESEPGATSAEAAQAPTEPEPTAIDKAPESPETAPEALSEAPQSPETGPEPEISLTRITQPEIAPDSGDETVASPGPVMVEAEPEDAGAAEPEAVSEAEAAPKKAKRPRAKAARSTEKAAPEDKRSAKLERAAKRRAGQRATPAKPPVVPPAPSERAFDTAPAEPEE